MTGDSVKKRKTWWPSDSSRRGAPDPHLARASQWPDAQASHDSGVIMCRRTLTQAYDDMRHGKLVSPALRVLQEIGGGNSPSAELHTVAKAVADHVALAMKWNLKPVFFQEGTDPRVCKVLLAGGVDGE